MDYFPLFARLENAPCLIVGGGGVAARKARQLLKAHASVTVCATEPQPMVSKLAADNKLQLLTRAFSEDLIAGRAFVVAATNDPRTNQAVARAASAAQVLCNVVDDRVNSTAILPAVVDRSPLIIAISSSGEAPVLATRIRQQLDRIIAPGTATLARFMGKWRDTIRDRFDNADDRRRFWQSLLDNEIADMLMEGDTSAAEQALEDYLQLYSTHTDDTSVTGSNSVRRRGIGMIVGAGPGDPELITLKALRALNTADVVMYDRLVAEDILDYARKDADFIYVGKEAGKASTCQEDINRQLVELVGEGKRVCRLKGGDPFVFGRGGEELAALTQAGLRWQVIPGITAASGCAAAAGIPLTHREVARSLTYTTAQANDGSEPDWPALARAEQTAVFYMPVNKLEQICVSLTEAGRNPDCPAAIIENGSRPEQRTVRGTLANLPAKALETQIASPALLIVGEVTAEHWPAAA